LSGFLQAVVEFFLCCLQEGAPILGCSEPTALTVILSCETTGRGCQALHHRVMGTNLCFIKCLGILYFTNIRADVIYASHQYIYSVLQHDRHIWDMTIRLRWICIITRERKRAYISTLLSRFQTILSEKFNDFEQIQRNSILDGITRMRTGYHLALMANSNIIT
jgi:hypothetical protein